VIFADRLKEDTLAIFLCHGVVDDVDYQVRNYNRKHISKDYFVSVLNEVSGAGTALSIEDAVRHINNKEPFPPRAFIITFDDGFRNNYEVAAPILEKFNIPAIFYITTDFIENNHMSWIDRIEFCCEHVEKKVVLLPWEAKPFRLDSVKEKISFLEYLRQYVKRDASIDTEELVKQIFAQCEMEEIETSNEPIDLKMNWREVKELSEHRLFTIGGHTHRHQNLGFLSGDGLVKEIAQSLRLIKTRADIETRHYSYPEGMEYCFNEDVISVLKNFGIICCPTAIDGDNDIDTDLFYLKRIAIV
jgi:peptidoglycan/xylan/chitin deacetylase (PgdA/CDA1 family)